MHNNYTPYDNRKYLWSYLSSSDNIFKIKKKKIRNFMFFEATSTTTTKDKQTRIVPGEKRKECNTNLFKRTHNIMATDQNK